jgi:glycyl-tRNA synthetase beta subunit
VENSPLETHERDFKHFLNNRVTELLKEEEIKWYQRAKIKELLQRDSNTKYFQLIANGKYRKTRIFQLQHEDKTIERVKELSEYVTKYYKELFSAPSENSFTIDEMRTDDINQVSEEENNLLI